MSFTPEQIEQIKKIKEGFNQLEHLYDEQGGYYVLNVSGILDEPCETPAFQMLFISNGKSLGRNERIILTEGLVFTDEKECQKIAEIAQSRLDYKEQRSAKEHENETTQPPDGQKGT